MDEDKRKLKREGNDGKEISYNPPRYTYYYDFIVIVNVNTPYFDEIRFKLGNDSVESPVPISKDGATARRQVFRPGMHMAAGGIPVEYEERERLGEEIKEALTQVRDEVRQMVAKANAPKVAVTCRWCGATTTPDETGVCEYCGGSLNG